MTAGGTVTTSEAAELLGLSGTASARTTLRRLGVHPVGRQAGSAGESLYDADQIAAAVAARPGRGARTDLRQVSNRP